LNPSVAGRGGGFKVRSFTGDVYVPPVLREDMSATVEELHAGALRVQPQAT
jgi:hypothetical protein